MEYDIYFTDENENTFKVLTFETILDARIYLVNAEIDLFNDDSISDIDYEFIIDEILQEKINNKEFIIKGE